MATSPTDLELMMLADGELDGDRAREVAAAVERDPVARAKLQSLAQVGERVRTYLEIETDHAESDVREFADMWAGIEREIKLDGQGAGRDEVLAPIRAPMPVPGMALWATTRNFLSGHRGHILSGLVSAGAVAALMLALGRPERTAGPSGPTRAIGSTPVNNQLPGGPVQIPPALAPASPPEVEDFEVYDGTGMVFTLPSEGEGDSSAAVIWINKDQDTVEDPI
jgi:hypothetical protein